MAAGGEAGPVSQPSGPTSAQAQHIASLIKARGFAELEALALELLAQRPDGAWIFTVLGLALWSQGKDARTALQKAAELLPTDAEAHRNLGNAYRAAGQLADAVASQRRAVALKPDSAEAHNDLGSALQDLDCLEAAAASFRRAVSLRPDFALAHANLGNVLLLQQRTDESEASCRRALDLNPRFAAAMVQLAELQAGRGEFTAAEDQLRRAIDIEPDMPEAWAGLVRWRKMSHGDTAWLGGAQRIADRPLAPGREIHLRYALGKYFDDVGDFEQAFANYRRANELAKLGRPPHDSRQWTHAIDRILESYDGDRFSRAGLVVNPSERPVLIVGMPRSGTTLAEQILASHAAVFGAGELPFWNAVAARYAASGSERDVPARVADEYLTVLSRLSAEALRVVDKMPANFLYLDLIHAAFPRARILHLKRNPIDTCLSIYFQNFSASHAYANDLDDLAHYYEQYARLMAHWHRSLPAGTMLDVPYEGLVDDPEGWSRRMIEFIGLPWDPNCLAHHRSHRTVGTFSKWQARQRINKSSVERWRHYQGFVGPLRRLASGQPHIRTPNDATEQDREPFAVEPTTP